MAIVDFDDTTSGQTLTMTAAIYSTLRSEIISLKRRPGEPLRRMLIAQSFGVSSMPVHEAMRKLETDGLIESVSARGTFVARIPLNALPTAIEARKVLEQKTVRCAAERATPADIDRFRKNLGVQRQAIRDADHAEFYRADEEFHALIAEVAAHPYFWSVTQKTKIQIDRCLRLSCPPQSHIAAFFADHEAIVEAIASRNPDQAAKALSRHFDIIRDSVKTTIDECPEYFEGTLEYPASA